MRWDLEELTEDAFVAYLEQQVGGEMRVYTAWGFNEAQYPCAIVHAGETEPVSEEAEWHDSRAMSVEVAVIVEATEKGNKTARETNASIRSMVMDALATSDLNTLLIGMQTPDIAFSMAQLASTARTVEDRKMITTMSLMVIAEPVTGS